jgi:hypothetical protein
MQLYYELSTILSFKHASNFVVFCLQIGTPFLPSFHIFLFYKFFIEINFTCFIFKFFSFAFDCSNFSKNITTYNMKWKIQIKWMFCQKRSFVLLLHMLNEMQIKIFTSIYKVKITHIAFLSSPYEKMKMQLVKILCNVK